MIYYRKYYDFIGVKNSKGLALYKDVKVYADNPQQAIQFYLNLRYFPRRKHLEEIRKYRNVLWIVEYIEVNRGKRGKTIKQFKKNAEWSILNIPLLKY